ncbi:DUF4105 domain-containing protein [Paraburkholderia aspalathi]|nr:DUF4105 domain-containing protein [Paraburkholderia aspalathi]
MAAFLNSTPIRILCKILYVLFIVIFGIWAGFAFWYQLPFGTAACSVIILLWGMFVLWILISERRQHCWHRRLVFGLCAIVVLGWWSTIRPSLERMWAPDVAQTVSATVQGDMATIRNIRSFDWRTTEDYTPEWKQQTYDLDTIDSVDVFLSYWAGPIIAHTLVSFGFADGRHLVFSAEIRREHHEEFSSIGGFFREFELAMIAAEENDIIYLRTNVRGEDVYRYKLDIEPDMAKKLFLSYLETGNELAVTPKFYNTLLTNCTTVVFKLARFLDPGIPFDYRILLSGFLPGYLYDHQLIATDLPLDQTIQQANINKRAVGSREQYSARIR